MVLAAKVVIVLQKEVKTTSVNYMSTLSTDCAQREGSSTLWYTSRTSLWLPKLRASTLITGTNKSKKKGKKLTKNNLFLKEEKC